MAFEAVKKSTKKTKIAKSRSKKYKNALKEINRNQEYSLSEAVKLVKQTSISRFNGTIELHLVVEEQGLGGEIKFPHPTGKTQKIAIATDEVLEKIKKGKIDFNVLVASPEMMPKLAPLAKMLGPKGLMPNPKNGTIGPNPEKLVTSLAGKVNFKTEKQAPLIHLVVGKTDLPEDELVENIKIALKALPSNKIKKAVLTSTMGPGIKINPASN